MRQGTKSYVDSVLDDLEKNLSRMLEEVHKNRAAMRK
jgi:hypothetical protein